MLVITWRRYGLMGPPRKSLDIAMQIARVVSKAYSKPSKFLGVQKRSVILQTSKYKRQAIDFNKRFLIKLKTKDLRKRFTKGVIKRKTIKRNVKTKYISK